MKRILLGIISCVIIVTPVHAASLTGNWILNANG